MSSRTAVLATALIAFAAAPARANDYDDAYTVDWAALAQGVPNPPGENPPGEDPPGTNPPGGNPPGAFAPGEKVPGAKPPDAPLQVSVVDVTPAPQRPWRPQQPTAPAPARGLTLRSDGRVTATKQVPRAVRRVIAAANRIAKTPYRYGGGHGAFNDSAYDCSGSVSFALHGAGLLNTTLNSTGFMSWGRRGRGRWISIYANHGHVFMVVGGLRYDTSARSNARGGSRWAPMDRSTRGFVVRHPAGL